MKTIALTLCFLILSSIVCVAANVPVNSVNDVVGCYELIDFSENAKKQINKIDPWPTRYQWFCFEQDGTMSTLASTVSQKTSEKELRKAFQNIPKDIKFFIPQKGVLVTEQKSANQKLAWGASFMENSVSFDGKIIEKGTLVMFLVNDSENKPVYFRYLKKIK